MQRQRRKLTVEDRVAIDLRHKDGWGVRAIARELGRSPSVISTEIVRGRDPDGSYAAGPAQAAATARRDRSGRRAKLAPDGALFAEVTKLLRLQWSPEQIAGRRQRREEGAEVASGLRVSHEAIYQAIYAVPRGELRRELLACLRQGKPHRGRRPKDGERRGRICDMTTIRERPEEVAGRLVPGHWEGDLIKGAGNRSSVGTLVERTSRKVILVKGHPGQAGRRQGGDGARWLRRRPAGGAGTTAPHPDLRPRQRDGSPQGAVRTHGPACLLRRPACPLAARVHREHQRPAAPGPAQGHRPVGGLASRTRRDRCPA